MNTRQVQCAVLLSQVRNFSQVAEKLGITQPALSKQILNLEKELGVRLFDRNTTPLTMTPAGEHFIREAKDMLYREDQLLRSMERFKTGEEGRLVIGISPFRSLYLLSDVVKKLRERYPRLQIFLQEYASEQLRREVAEGKYDFAIVNLPVDQSLLDVTPLEPDTLVLAVPNTMLPLVKDRPQGGQVQIDFSACRDLPFITLSSAQEMRKLFDGLCAASGFIPNIAMEVIGISTALAMVNAGIGATLLPLQYVRSENFGRDISLFTLKETLYTRQPAIVTRRGQYRSEYAQYAISLLQSKS
ncbi:MAG: LysR family transcriptional regulator [Clostridia bacterium]|nr:LysR family transcriptional regulator [Clostridia bacterium]